MTPQLSDDQRRAIQEQGGAPVYVVDAATDAHYVLMRAEQFEQVKAWLEAEEFDPRQAYPFVDRVMHEDDADDPALASYQEFPERKP